MNTAAATARGECCPPNADSSHYKATRPISNASHLIECTLVLSAAVVIEGSQRDSFLGQYKTFLLLLDGAQAVALDDSRT